MYTVKTKNHISKCFEYINTVRTILNYGLYTQPFRTELKIRNNRECWYFCTFTKNK